MSVVELGDVICPRCGNWDLDIVYGFDKIGNDTSHLKCESCGFTGQIEDFKRDRR